MSIANDNNQANLSENNSNKQFTSGGKQNKAATRQVPMANKPAKPATCNIQLAKYRRNADIGRCHHCRYANTFHFSYPRIWVQMHVYVMLTDVWGKVQCIRRIGVGDTYSCIIDKQ